MPRRAPNNTTTATQTRQISLPWAAPGSAPPPSPAPVPAPAAQPAPAQPAPAPEPPPDYYTPPKPEAMNRFAKAIAARVRYPVRRIVLTINRSTMISARGREGHPVVLRIHRMFLDAPEHVLDAVAQYVHGSPSPPAVDAVTAYIDQEAAKYRAFHLRALHEIVPARGVNFDLQAIFDRLNRDYFRGSIQGVKIGWGTGGSPQGRRRSSMRLGSYRDDLRLITLHPSLDHPAVPACVIETTVFHEMLHHVIKPRMEHGRRIVHPPEFRDLERRFPGYHESEAWCRQHLAALD